MLTCKAGALSEDKPKGIDKEFVGLFTVLDENESWLLDENINTYCTEPGRVNKEDEDFMESNKMHAINGYFYGNLQGLEICQGDTVRWHLAGIGNEVDIHTGEFVGTMLQTFQEVETTSHMALIGDVLLSKRRQPTGIERNSVTGCVDRDNVFSIPFCLLCDSDFLSLTKQATC